MDLAARHRNPICCVAEENVLMSRRNGHVDESILVHEFAHNVMSIGFDANMTVACRLLQRLP